MRANKTINASNNWNNYAVFKQMTDIIKITGPLA